MIKYALKITLEFDIFLSLILKIFYIQVNAQLVMLITQNIFQDLMNKNHY